MLKPMSFLQIHKIPMGDTRARSGETPDVETDELLCVILFKLASH
jgi:hypothetical protein